MQILGIPLNAPTKKDMKAALVLTAIIGIVVLVMATVGAISINNAVLLSVGAFVGGISSAIGIDPKKHGLRAWFAFIIIATITFLMAELSLQNIATLAKPKKPTTEELLAESIRNKPDVKKDTNTAVLPDTKIEDNRNYRPSYPDISAKTPNTESKETVSSNNDKAGYLGSVTVELPVTTVTAKREPLVDKPVTPSVSENGKSIKEESKSLTD